MNNNSVFCRGGKYTEDDAKAVMIQILNVVAFCHLQGVVHRDLKPEVKYFSHFHLSADVVLIDYLRPFELLVKYSTIHLLLVKFTAISLLLSCFYFMILSKCSCLLDQNFLFTTEDENSVLKAIDFGLSDFVKPGFMSLLNESVCVVPFHSCMNC